MRVILAILAGLVGAAAGWAATAFGALIISGYLGMSDFEGGRAMTAFFGFGPVGGLLGLVAGIWLALRAGSPDRNLGVMAKRGAIALGAIVLLAAGVFAYLSTFDEVAERNGPTPLAEFEIRLPAGMPAPAREGLRIVLDTDKNQTDAALHTDWLRKDGARAVLVGSVPLYVNTTQRIIVLRSTGRPDFLFKLKLAGDPRGSPAMGPWQKVDFAAEAQMQPRPPQAGEDYEIRYRVQRID
jgi:MFS family permease